EMDRRLEGKLRISQKETVSSNNSTQSPLKTAIMIQDDSPHAVPLPQIRILKRPSSNGSLGSPQGQNRPTPQVKSLAQREAEYAEARKRILGSASPEESPQEKPNTDRAYKFYHTSRGPIKQSCCPPTSRPRRHSRLLPKQISGGGAILPLGEMKMKCLGSLLKG
ncbi:unnamed protein product, partial [Coregonus sp. 'balchen']